MKLVTRNSKDFDAFARQGVICYECGEWLYQEYDLAPGHITYCDKCNEAIEKSRVKMSQRPRPLIYHKIRGKNKRSLYDTVPRSSEPTTGSN